MSQALIGKYLLDEMKKQGVIPAGCRRAVINIAYDCCVTIYCESMNAGPLLEIDWANVEAEIRMVDGTDRTEGTNEKGEVESDGNSRRERR